MALLHQIKMCEAHVGCKTEVILMLIGVRESCWHSKKTTLKYVRVALHLTEILFMNPKKKRNEMLCIESEYFRAVHANSPFD